MTTVSTVLGPVDSSQLSVTLSREYILSSNAGLPVIIPSCSPGQVSRRRIEILKDEGVPLHRVKLDHSKRLSLSKKCCLSRVVCYERLLKYH